MESQENTIVFVVGMHRSGTSMLTKILNICGMNIGSDDELIPAHESNPKGHFEHIDFLNINIEILELLDGNTFVLPVVKENWEFDSKLNPLLEKAKKIVDRMNQKYILWGVKDPRFSFTLPFWKRLIPNMKIIIPVRNYRNVCASLMKRDSISEISANIYYLSYWQHILRNTGDKERLFVLYDELIELRDDALMKIQKYINHPNFFINDSRLSDLNIFVEKELRHHTSLELTNLEMTLKLGQSKNNSLIDALNNDILVIFNHLLSSSQNEKIQIEKKSEIIKMQNLLINQLRNESNEQIANYESKETVYQNLILEQQKVINNYKESISVRLTELLIKPLDYLLKNNSNYKPFIQKLRSININKHRFKGPDFIIIGAARSGTTSLFKYLSLHPRIKLPSLKELHYFYFRNEENKTIDWYLNQFPQLEKGQITGEATPYYIFHPLVPQIIKKTFPDVKIIALLRDPIDRAVSHYFHCNKLGIGVNIKEMDIHEAFKYDITHNPIEEEKLINNPNYYSVSHQHNSFVLRGDYKKQLKRWENHFNKKNIKVIKSEDFYNNSFNSLNQICDFLGIEHFDVSIKSNLIVHNKIEYNPLTFEEKQYLREYFTYLD